jgi:hypothetical protein
MKTRKFNTAFGKLPSLETTPIHLQLSPVLTKRTISLNNPAQKGNNEPFTVHNSIFIIKFQFEPRVNMEYI